MRITELHKGAMTPELDTLSVTPEEAGYFSDECGGGRPQMKIHRKRSNKQEKRLSSQGSLTLTSNQLVSNTCTEQSSREGLANIH